ncbi:hypothetical protein COCOR_03388 [Corallococcus coralloides DSM 2259]|uniref:Lipoprotein n=2 Tax=Corallococcus coralloides TaxID=184914 RepID=H8MJ73_CORCM|nr:hypothetical protein COCOR_03388 [Corallococcus coralloides DSM 2259]
MRVQGVLGLLSMGLFALGCGGVDTEVPVDETVATQDQALYDCEPGDEGYPVWECTQIDECGGRWGNLMRYYCYSPSTGGYYPGGVITYNCGDCY